tara:strand:+ start:1315 stop:1893 length:579 start_codon:yes stop_codon:yes gene_type:complete
VKKIGITGSIGSGKTYVSKVFESLGISVFNADNEAKKIMSCSFDLINSIKNEFGEDIYDKYSLNKKKLASIVFSDSAKLKKLNSIVHPIVKQEFLNWCKIQKSPYVIKEAAILFESNSYKELDSIICVSAPKKLRIDRVRLRDSLKDYEINNRMRNQFSQEQKENLSDYIIVNDEKELLLNQIIRIHEKLIN